MMLSISLVHFASVVLSVQSGSLSLEGTLLAMGSLSVDGAFFTHWFTLSKWCFQQGWFTLS